MSVVMRELGFSQFGVDESAWVASATDQPINAVCKTGATVRVATTPVGQDSSKHALHGPLTEAEPVEVARKAVLLDGCSGSVTLRGNPIKVRLLSHRASTSPPIGGYSQLHRSARHH